MTRWPRTIPQSKRATRGPMSTAARLKTSTLPWVVFLLSGPVLASNDTPSVPRTRVATNQSVDLSRTNSDPAADSVSDSAGATPAQVEPARRIGADGPVTESHATETIPREVVPSTAHRRSGGLATYALGKGVGALAVVLILVAISYWGVRRLVPSVRGAESGVLKVTGRVSLTAKHHAALVLVGRRYVLIGISPEGISSLCEVTDPGEVAELMSRTAATGGKEHAAFEEQLLREVGQYGPASGESMPDTPPETNRPRSASGPLGELLHKLRAMHST